MSWIENLRSADWNQAGVVCLFAYLLGCFSSGYYLVRLVADKDIRQLGSGSAGARNVGRVLGKTGFVLTLLCDLGKGALAVWTARCVTPDGRVAALAMLAAVAGHLWPAQLRFQGGKGMATSLGALLVYDLQLALTFGVLCACLMAVMRRVVRPSLIALACLPAAALLLGHPQSKIVLLSFLAGLVIIGHRKNLTEEFAFAAGRRPWPPKPDRTRL